MTQAHADGMENPCTEEMLEGKGLCQRSMDRMHNGLIGQPEIAPLPC